MYWKIKESINMGLFSKLKTFFKGTRYKINREILASYVKESMKLSVEYDLSSVDEFYLSSADGEAEDHIVITNNDATCKNPLESEVNLTGFTLYVNRTSYYDPEKDEVFHSIEELIDNKLAYYPEWFLMRNDSGEPVKLEPYKYHET